MPSPPQSTLQEIEQFGKVLTFRLAPELKGLVWNYGGPAEFAGIVEPRLIIVLGRFYAAERSSALATKDTDPRIYSSALQLACGRIAGLARKHDTTRANLPFGAPRTRPMTLIESGCARSRRL